MRKRVLAFFGVAVCGTALILACSGSSGSDITDQPGSSSGTSGSSSGASSGSTSGDVACAPCPTMPPSPDCKGTTPCGCAPYTCPDGGTADGGPTACTWAKADPCGPGKYCDAPTCGAGTCVAIPTGAPMPSRDPVCGCDGITYWNATVAQTSGMSWDTKGACTPGTTCGGIANLQCPGKSRCAHARETKPSCNVADFGGKCWMLPEACPAIVVGVQTRSCDEGKCADECTLIRSQQPFYRDNTCPQ